MEEKTTRHAASSSPLWARLDVVVREQLQRVIQARLEEEVTAL